MSALAEGSLEALKLALWLWGSCVVSATPWVEKERGREREWETEMLSSCLAARLLQPKPVVVGQRGILSSVKPMLLNVNLVEETGISFLFWSHEVCHMHTAATFAHLDKNNGRQASTHACHQVFTSLMSEESKANSFECEFYRATLFMYLHISMY